jgi:hypothetical protein
VVKGRVVWEVFVVFNRVGRNNKFTTPVSVCQNKNIVIIGREMAVVTPGQRRRRETGLEGGGCDQYKYLWGVDSVLVVLECIHPSLAFRVSLWYNHSVSFLTFCEC